MDEQEQQYEADMNAEGQAMNEAAAESQSERDAENAIVPDHTKTTDLSEIENKPEVNEYTGPVTEQKSDYPGNRGY